jgi:hemerythrin-like domain-containing protein
MPRYNTFNQIHKALRALLYDAALCLQQTDIDDGESCDAIVEKVVAILDLFEAHAYNEDQHLLPAVALFEPSVADVFEQEHETGLRLSKTIQETIAGLYRTKQQADKVRLGNSLTRTFIQFMIFNLNHMAKEEEVLNAFLWRYYSDAEIKQMERIIQQNTPPEKQPFVARWMLCGISNNEAAGRLNEVKQQAPASQFEAVLALAQTELPENRFTQIAAHFSETASA